MNVYMLKRIMKTCYDRGSTGDWLNSRCGHSMQPEAMFDHKKDLLFNDFLIYSANSGVWPDRWQPS